MVDFLANYGYWGLFLGALLAGSILPFSSEILLSGLLLAGANPVLCLVSATAGNTLGGMTCFWLGKLGKMDLLERRFGIKEEKVKLWSDKLRNKGAVLAVLGFLPFVGEVIEVALGYLRSNGWLVCLFIAVGKGLRYFAWLMAHIYIAS